MSLPPITNSPNPLPTANPIETIIDTAISDGTSAGETAVDTAAETSQPWLAFPIIKQLFQALVSYILGIASKTGQLAITFGINKIQTGAQNSTLQKAEQEVQTAIAGGNPNDIAKAEADFQKADSAAVNNDGSATPQ